MSKYNFTQEELDRIDAEMGEMYYDCPKCGNCQRLGNLAKALYKNNPYEFKSKTCATCRHEFNAAPRVKFGKCPGFDYSKLEYPTQTEHRTVSVKFCVSVPSSSESVFLSGSFNGWNPAGLSLKMTNPCEATGTLDLPEGQSIEYKYTRGSWQTVERTGGQVDIANRKTVVLFGSTGSMEITDTVQWWADWERKFDPSQEWQSSTGQHVRFKRKHSKPGLAGGTDTFEEWTAPSAQAAREYLNTRSITDGQYYLVVETPEGNWGKDAVGIYKE